MLTDQIRARVKEAMKARNVVEKEILKVALGEIETEQTRRGADMSDADVEKVLRKLVKSNRETHDATSDPDKQAVLREEIAILESLLPKTLGEDEIVAALAGVADAIRSAPGDGPATGVAMKHLKQIGATVDGKTVSAAVRKLRG